MCIYGVMSLFEYLFNAILQYSRVALTLLSSAADGVVLSRHNTKVFE